MQLIKKKARFNGRDINLKLNLSSNSNLNGLQESIDDFIEEETGLSINPAVDGERFRYRNTESSFGLTFNFYDSITNPVFSNTLEFAGFTPEEIAIRSDTLRASFFILQIYDSIKKENQTLLHTGFINGFNFTGETTTYSVDSTTEASYIYLPENIINSISGDTPTLYVKFFFFNAKFGNLQVFYNENNESLTTEEKLYYELTVNKTNKTYTYTNNNMVLKESLSTQYNENINNRLNKFRFEKPTYPVGQFFTNEGDYEEID